MIGPARAATVAPMPDRPDTTSDLVTDAAVVSGDGGDVLVAKLHGEVSLHNSPALRADLLKLVQERKPTAAILNLAGVPYMDSSAIAVLVEVLKAIRGGGGKVYLTDLQQRVDGLLHIARLDSIFEMRPDEATARKEAGVGEAAGEAADAD